MSNIFEDVMGDLNSLEDELLGPSYNYSDQIKSPDKMGMSGKGTMSTLSKDISGLTSYVELLVTGKSNASKTGKPLGDKFFLETGAQCKDTDTGEKVTRSIYINNVPDGDIPFISSGMGTNFSDFEGLIPGIMSNLAQINPLEILQSFMLGSEPDCTLTKLQTIDSNNNKSYESKYLTTLDIQNMNACWFPDNKNPVTKAKCSETFTTLHDSQIKSDDKLDLVTNIYIGSLGLFGLYLFYNILRKK